MCSKSCCWFLFLCSFSVPKLRKCIHVLSPINVVCVCFICTCCVNELKETFSSWWEVPSVFPTLNFRFTTWNWQIWGGPGANQWLPLQWPLGNRDASPPTKDSNHHQVGDPCELTFHWVGGRVDTINIWEGNPYNAPFFVSSQFSRRWKNECSHFWPIYWTPYAPNKAGSSKMRISNGANLLFQVWVCTSLFASRGHLGEGIWVSLSADR